MRVGVMMAEDHAAGTGDGAREGEHHAALRDHGGDPCAAAPGQRLAEGGHSA
jgi:hypothetical protein